MELPKQYGQPFRAVIKAHNWRGGCNLAIGAEGYNDESVVVLTCTEEERRQFPIGTKFDLVCVEETRGVACPSCGGSGEERNPPHYNRQYCRGCKGTGRNK